MSSRIGLLMRKVGCTTVFDTNDSVQKAGTVLLLEDSCILSIRKDKEIGCFIQVGFGSKSAKRLNKPQRDMFLKMGVDCKKKIVEFKVSEKCVNELHVSQRLSVDYFTVNQYVDVVGTSIGKGFAGVMKRHNFSGLAASHGVSISHRSQGSTGQCQDPGRVFKGKKMAGLLGGNRVTIQNLRIIHLDVKKQFLIVFGSVPGAKNSYVLLKDSIKKCFFG